MTNLYNYITQLSTPLFRLGYVDGNGVYCITNTNFWGLVDRTGSYLSAERYIHRLTECNYLRLTIITYNGHIVSPIQEWREIGECYV